MRHMSLQFDNFRTFVASSYFFYSIANAKRFFSLQPVFIASRQQKEKKYITSDLGDGGVVN